MDQNSLIAQLIPKYQKFLFSEIEKEEKAAAKLRPTEEKEEGEIESSVEEVTEEITEEVEVPNVSEDETEEDETDEILEAKGS
ncbi:MAG: hypothetical protein AAF902_02330 [Chloroflexota bacterium]